MGVQVRPLGGDDRPWARERTVQWWGSLIVVAHGRVHEPAELDGFVAEVDGARAGLLTYLVEGDTCEIVTMNAEMPNRGVGTALLDAVRGLGHARYALTTTANNGRAIAFYERRGFRVAAVH